MLIIVADTTDPWAKNIAMRDMVAGALKANIPLLTTEAALRAFVERREKLPNKYHRRLIPSKDRLTRLHT